MDTAHHAEANLAVLSEAGFQRWLRRKGILQRDRRLDDLKTKKLQPAGRAHAYFEIYEDFLGRGARQRIKVYKRTASGAGCAEMFAAPRIEAFRQLIMATVENGLRDLNERISRYLNSVGDLSPALRLALLDERRYDQLRSRILDIVNGELGVLEAEGKLKRQRDRSGDSLATELERKQGTTAPKHHPARDEFLVPHRLKSSRNAIAEDADITPSSLQRWHEGKSRLSPDNLSKLAKRLKVDARTIPNE